MNMKAFYENRLYYLVATLFIAGWGFFCTFLPEGTSWINTAPLFVYSSGCIALALVTVRWLKRKNDSLTMYDPEMGLYSERFFFYALGLEYNRSNRHELPLSLIVFSFETIQETADQLGKTVEEVQKLFIETVSETIRNSDIFSTLEEDKFSILLPSTDVDGAKVAAARLKRAIASELKKQRLGQRTSMPFGICGTSPNVKTSQDLLNGSIKAYDAALNSPRNKIVTCDDGW
jgi:diguanylate cyclase (GGDEF)-like protein